jgi:hypothetical protein
MTLIIYPIPYNQSMTIEDLNKIDSLVIKYRMYQLLEEYYCGMSLLTKKMFETLLYIFFLYYIYILSF